MAHHDGAALHGAAQVRLCDLNQQRVVQRQDLRCSGYERYVVSADQIVSRVQSPS